MRPIQTNEKKKTIFDLKILTIARLRFLWAVFKWRGEWSYFWLWNYLTSFSSKHVSECLCVLSCSVWFLCNFSVMDSSTTVLDGSRPTSWRVQMGGWANQKLKCLSLLQLSHLIDVGHPSGFARSISRLFASFTVWFCNVGFVCIVFLVWLDLSRNRLILLWFFVLFVV